VPRSAEANQRIRAERRSAILHTAAPVFARKGFAGTRITDLVEASGMSQGLLYRYFDGKDAVFAEVVAEAVQQSILLAQAARTRDASPWEQLRWFVATFLPLQYECPDYALVVSHALTSEATPPAVREGTLRGLITFTSLIRDVIVAGQMAGEMIVRDPGQLAMNLLATLHGLASAAAFSRQQPFPLPDPEIVLLALRPTPTPSAASSSCA
jgi:AcrR family transcriptional regulator